MELLAAYLPADRRQALAQGRALPDRTQGTALIADISGFTPLTESLLNALGPRRGAEELSRLLNTVFDALIAQVDRYGGSVLSFTGDAITCWFEGDTGQRAATCGLAMQAAMRPFAAATLSTGQVATLAMKVALATGPARRLAVGDPAIQRLDVLAGATLDRMAAAEHQAERGEVMAEASTLEQLGAEAEIAREVAADHGRYAALRRLKRRARQRPASSPDDVQLAEAALRPWLLPPVYARLREGPAHFLAEIRPSVALFMSFGGIDYDLDPQAGQKLDAYLCGAQQVLRRYDAYVLQLTLGDKGCYLCAAFGAPLAHDDDLLRAVAAALDLHALGCRHDYIRDVRIGLNQGRVWCGAYGGRTRHTYGVLGDVVNVAARLMGHAAPGTTLLSPTMAQAVEAHYALEAVGELQLKGKAEPMPAFRLGRSLAAGGFLLQTLAYPLIGRQAELAWLEALWQAVQRGTGRVARLTGAGGVGKSHVVKEFVIAAANEGALVGIGLCHDAEQFVAYKPWRSPLLRLLNVPEGGLSPERQAEAAQQALCALDPAWKVRAPLLGDVLNLPIPDNPVTGTLEPKLRREATWALVVDVVRAVARRQPLVLWLDNVQGMDEASCALTLAVSRTLEHSPALLLCTQRPLLRGESDPFAEWEGWPVYEARTLPVLADDEVAALMQARLGGHVRPLALAVLQKQAQGNAFYAGELVTAMREAGHLIQRDDGDWHLSARLFALLQDQHCLRRSPEHGWWTLVPDAILSAEALGLPDSIQRTITARLDQLAPETQLTIKTASVIGLRFETEILVLAHPRYPGRAALESHLAELELRRLVHADEPGSQPAYVFEHNLVQEGIYNSLLSEQQTLLHATVGAALEEVRPEAVDQLAYHYSHTQDRAKALAYLGQAADKARRNYANETALKYYEQALALESRWEWGKAQIDVLGLLGRRVEQRAALEALAAMRGAPAFEVAYLWGQYYEAVSDYTRAREALERARTIAHERFHRAHEAASLNQLGLIAYRQGDYEQAKGWFRQAEASVAGQATHSADETRVLARALVGLGLIGGQQGDFAGARRYHEHALGLYREMGDRQGEANVLNHLGGIANYQRNFSEAKDWFQQALAIRRVIGDRLGEGVSLGNLAQAARDAGQYDVALDYLERALRIHQAIGNRWEEANVCNDLGICYQELGRLEQAQAILEAGAKLCRDIGDETGYAYLLSNLGLTACDQGRLDQAEAWWSSGLPLARQQQDRRLESNFASYLGLVFLQKGDSAKAIEWASAALSMHRELGMEMRDTDDLATLALAYSATQPAASALDHARQALANLKRSGGEGPEFPQRDYWACYRVLETCGEHAEACAALQAAYDWVMKRAARITDSELRHSFLENAPRNRQVVEEAERVLGVAGET